MILLIDNYDSFSYNLFQRVGAFSPDIRVVRNDGITTEEVQALAPEAILLSPGPGRPENAGICIGVVQNLGPKIPILGVCLGHQSICAAYGAEITYAKTLMHGKQSLTGLDTDCPLFQGLPGTILTARYHSLAVAEESLPPCLAITARADDGEIMAVMHREYPVFGLQFHPESIMTPDGPAILHRFLELAKERAK